MRRLTLFVMAAGLALAGCKKKSSTPPTTPDPEVKEEEVKEKDEVAAAPGDCEAAATNVDRLLRAQAGAQIPDDKYAELHAIVVTHCQNDGWSAEAIACITEATSGEQLEEKCENTLSKEQSDAVDEEFERVLGGGPPPDGE